MAPAENKPTFWAAGPIVRQLAEQRRARNWKRAIMFVIFVGGVALLEYLVMIL